MGLRVADALVISVLAGIVCLVSLPRLADYVRSSNEEDARLALGLLGPAFFPEGATVPAGDLTDLGAWSGTLRHRLRDARPLEDASALLYHGYLFSLRSMGGETWLVAWPREGGRTGVGVFAWSPTRGALRAEALQRERWMGVAGAGEDLADAGWAPLD